MSRGTQALIHLNHLKHNYQLLKQESDSKLVLVVKADAYGHGLKQVVSFLGDVDCYAVATLNEAKVIRSVLPKVRILLLEGFFDADELLWAQNNSVDCVIHNQYQLQLLKGNYTQYTSHCNHPKKQNTTQKITSQNPINIWLKMDSGMNRLGFSPKDFETAIKQLENMQSCWNELILMSHFANADVAEDSFNSLQQDVFFEIAKKYNYPTSFKNSSAHLNSFDFSDDWTRIGIALFGVSPLKNKTAKDFGLKPVMSVVANIIELKKVKQGEGIGYGQNFTANQDMQIAIVGIGYGDGYPLNLHATSEVAIGKHKLAVVGRVSMDMIAVDVSSMDEVKLGQTVLIWGEFQQASYPLESLASKIETIPYVLLCGLTSRVEFNYIENKDEIIG